MRLPEAPEEAEAVLALLEKLSDAGADAAEEAPPQPQRKPASKPAAKLVSKPAAATRADVAPAAAARPLGKSSLLLPAMSGEQAAVAREFVSGGCNVAVNAVAGSGKTTCILHCAQALREASPGSRVLVVTYNARLKEETRRKARALGLDSSLEVHSYHAFAVKYYADTCYKDSGIKTVVDRDLAPKRRFSFDRIVVDEAQDMTPLFFGLVCKAMRDNVHDALCPVMLLGDQHQNIYGFNHADARYLTLASRVFAGVVPPLPWRTLTLSTTYRLSANMVQFINTHVLRRQHFNTPNGVGDKVFYYRGSPFQIAALVADKLILRLSRRELLPSNIFVLSPTVRAGTSSNPTPYNVLENRLVRAGYPCFSSTSDDARLDDEVIRDKVVFSTFHSVKGLERKEVVVFSFSQAYFDVFAKLTNYSRQLACPNALYVALTRATQTLHLIGEETEGGTLPFLTMILNTPYLQVQTVGPLRKKPDSQQQGWSKASVTRLTRFLTDATISEALRYVRTRVVQAATENIPVPLRVKTQGEEAVLVEEVSELNGLAVPAMYESKSTGKMSSMQQYCISELPIGDSYHDAAKKKTVTMADYLRLAAVYGYVTGGFVSKPTQLKDFDWLTPDLAQPLLGVIDAHLGGQKIDYEAAVLLTALSVGSREAIAKVSPMEVTGRIDAVSPEFIYELKCTGAIESEHLLQLALYGWLWNVLPADTGQKCAATHGPRKLRILNFRTGELLEVTSSPAELAQAARVLIEEYLRGDPDHSDDDFLQNCGEHKAKFLRAK